MKDCFGKFAQIEGGFIKCDGECGADGAIEKWKCITDQNIKQGRCECPFKASCHVGRQSIQSSNKLEAKRCMFYKALKPQYDKLIAEGKMELKEGIYISTKEEVI